MEYRPADRLRYLFIDFNAFFASVEQHDEPALRGRPVIVTPLASEHTGAIAASYEARAFGIKRGTKVFEARQLCPEIAVRPARHDRYVAIHHEIMTEIEHHLPLEKIYSVDEAAFRLNRSEGEATAALRIADQVRLGLRDNIGPALRASIGLAQTRLLAKLAAESHKPDGMTVLTPDDLPNRLIDMPLRDIPGVGKGVEARLARNNVTNFMALWRLPPKRARQIWGSVQGERFWYALHGFEVDEPEPKKSMIGHSRVLTKTHETPDKARIVARALLLKAASRLRQYGLYARRLSVSFRLRPEGRWDGARKLDPSQDSFYFLRTFDDLWEGFLNEQGRDGGFTRLGGATVYLHGLCAAGDVQARQQDLFAEPEADEKTTARAKLWAAIDAINADKTGKFKKLAGANAASKTGPAKKHIVLARQQGLDLNYLGAKIAFSRVPDESEFLY